MKSLEPARQYFANNQYSKAIKYLKKEVLNDSIYMQDKTVATEAHVIMGESLLEKNMLEEADSMFHEVLDGSASKSIAHRSYIGLARINLKKGHFTEAENYCSLLASSGYNSVDLFQIMGNISSALGRFEEAKNFLKVSKDSFRAPIDSIQAEEYLLLLYDILNNAILSDSPQSAETEVQEIYEISDTFFAYISPQKARALEKVGSWKVFMNEYDDAQKDLQAARTIYDSLNVPGRQYVTLILHQGYANRLSGNYQISLNFFGEAFGLVPDKELKENPF